MASAYPPTGSQPPVVELVVRQGPRPGQRFPLTRPTITIGREAVNNIPISDRQISRHHASLNWDGRQFIIQDLGSANGTFINGARLTGPQILQPGDVIGLGPAVLLDFRVAPPAYAPPRPPVPPPAYAPGPPPRRRRFLIPLAVLLGLCCILALAAAAAYYFLWPGSEPETKPSVLIDMPAYGDQVEVGQAVTVHSVARDEGKVVRVELWADGQLHKVQASNLPGGVSPFPLLARWQPSSPGTHTLTARAFNACGGRSQASVNVEAVAAVDRDGDGATGEADLCPDQPGAAAADGCPDRDGDSVPDSTDECPDQPGTPLTGGCPDADGDTIPDSEDECPDQPGTPMTEGCPDADGDTIPDGMDACPDEPGGPGAPGGDGCPASTGEDRDGDGIPDGEDGCPDEGGSPATEGCPDADGDGVPDSVDACPSEPGPVENDGCPGPVDAEDSDGDGISDGDDECPREPGPEPSGCPDRDGDGVPDPEDLRPDDPGPPEGGGAPETGAGDRDGDGIPDDADLCPDHEGLPEHAGCPPPPVSEVEEPGAIPLWPPPGGGVFGEGGDSGTVFPVVLDALEFEVSDRYDEVYCYAGLAGRDMERYGPFEAMDETHWNIAEHLGGENSRTVPVHDDESLEVRVECGAYNVYRSPEGEEATYWNLGSFTRYHPQSDWDGHVIAMSSAGGSDVRSLLFCNRLCTDSCEEAAFAPPSLTLWRGLGDQLRLQWSWGGDESEITGFKLYVNDNFYTSPRRDLRSYELHSDLLPSCGERLEFQVTAYSGATLVPDRESPRSNIRFLESPPCPRTVRVTFDRLRTYNLEDGDPNRNWDERRLGPISGTFCAQGSTGECLNFNASNYPNGLMLQSEHNHSIQGIFNWILAEMSVPCHGSSCPVHYSAPLNNSVTVDLGLGDDLTFTGVIFETDDRSYGEAFHASDSISADEIRPGYSRTIRDQQIELRVLLDVVSSYEADVPAESGRPDLTITDVDQHEPSGQLRIHVSNIGGDLTSEDIAVALARSSTNEALSVQTWENVTISSGEGRILQSHDLGIEPSDLRVTIDPDNRIEETYEGNNTYETPAVMRVEFVQLAVPGYPCEGFLDQEGELWFLFDVGYGPSRDDANWVGYRIRYPESDYHELDTSAGSRWDPWSLEGQERYTFEFEIPVDENLYISIQGREHDITREQSMGSIVAEYGPDANYGDRSDAYRSRSSGVGTEYCGEWEGIGPTYFGFEAWWRITRVR